VEATTVAAVVGTVDLGEVLAWYGEAMGELDRTLGAVGVSSVGPPGGLYDNELFADERGEAVVYIPVTDVPTLGRVRPFVIPAGDLAITVHEGSHDDIDVSYEALGTYVTEHALGVAGPVHEIYLIGPRDTEERSSWRTEIGWPVFRTTAK
jgi:effector-binding domain-containing protein